MTHMIRLSRRGLLIGIAVAALGIQASRADDPYGRIIDRLDLIDPCLVNCTRHNGSSAHAKKDRSNF